MSPRRKEDREGGRSSQSAWLFRYSTVGIQVVLTFLFFTLIGLWLDRHYGWSPWGLLAGLIVGFVAMVVALFREAGPPPRGREEGGGRDREGDG